MSSIENAYTGHFRKPSYDVRVSGPYADEKYLNMTVDPNDGKITVECALLPDMPAKKANYNKLSTEPPRNKARDIMCGECTLKACRTSIEQSTE